ncbi:MAG: tRNA (adenosine(37)-N6)-dimethylallyltransferase MiaA [Collinsella sp.]|nr:tRNA (adenosine(37)-N6)-dimethylallyltransferase MiaA [Collinsella sp.]
MVSSGAGLSAVAIVGPTAVGKSDVADRLAARLSSEVLSCDAMQIYRGMDIGTAKMSPDECTAPLRLVDIVEPGVAYSAALYQADARAHVERLLGSGCLPVFCGGTGLYLKAALDEMDFPSGELEDDRRVGYQELAERIGEEELHALLAERDPESAAVIHPHNVRRVIRALEMHDDGVSYAQQKSQFSVPREHYHALWFGLTRNREILYERISLRVDLMFEQGLVDEVRGLMGQGLGDALTSMQAIGYKEIIDAFNGVMSMDEARELIKMRSRRYAKRQLSWFKRDDRIVWFDMDECTIDEVVEDILHRIEAA